jgi:hypothetical protein
MGDLTARALVLFRRTLETAVAMAASAIYRPTKLVPPKNKISIVVAFVLADKRSWNMSPKADTAILPIASPLGLNELMTPAQRDRVLLLVEKGMSYRSIERLTGHRRETVFTVCAPRGSQLGDEIVLSRSQPELDPTAFVKLTCW